MAAGTHEALTEASAVLVGAIKAHEEAKGIYQVALQDLRSAEQRMGAAYATEVEAHESLRAEMTARRKSR